MTCWCLLAGNIALEMYFLVKLFSIKTSPRLSLKVGEIGGKTI